MKQNEKDNLRIDLLNLEKLSGESMGDIIGASPVPDPYCQCTFRRDREQTWTETIRNTPF